MSNEPPVESPESQESPPRQRKGPPAWGVVLFLVLLGGMLMINQWATTSGPPIQWVENDLERALEQLDENKRRVFLYLYEPNDPAHQRNERQVFTQRWAREPLTSVVCCRYALKPGELRSAELRQEYTYRDQPLFLLLNASGQPVSRTQGEVTELEFLTYIGRPAQRSYKEAPEATPEKDNG